MADRVAGVVRRRVAFAGSKSERDALVIDSGADQILLRRRGANPFEVDPDLASLEGKTIEVHGTRAGASFLVDGWDESG